MASNSKKPAKRKDEGIEAKPGALGQSGKDQDEAKLETLAKRLLATPPKPRGSSKPKKPNPKAARGKRPSK